MSVKKIVVTISCLFLMQCGTDSQTLQILYAGADAFGDTDTTDVVFCVRNVPVNGVGLDENNDEIPDLFLFPSTCGNVGSCSSAKAVGCGFDVDDSGSVTLGDIPIDFRYEIRTEFRDATGTVLYCGEQEFENNGNASVTVTIAAGVCS